MNPVRYRILKFAKKLADPALDVAWAVERAATSKCPVCGRAGRLGRIHGYGRTFLKCPQCSHIWAHDYSRLRANLGMGMEIGLVPPGETHRPEMGGESEEFLSRFCRETFGVRSILLYGTGPTRAFRALLEEGVDVYGCDISPSVLAYRQREFGTERFFHVREMDRRRFDLVVATEVIEHFFDPLPEFTRIASVLEPEGIFCGSTNFSLRGGVEDDDGFGYMSHRGHVVYWSDSSLRSAFARLGWTFHSFQFDFSIPTNRRFFFGTRHAPWSAALDRMVRDTPVLPFREALTV
jgi:SAM-dependent methyltransferase